MKWFIISFIWSFSGIITYVLMTLKYAKKDIIIKDIPLILLSSILGLVITMIALACVLNDFYQNNNSYILIKCQKTKELERIKTAEFDNKP